MSKNYKKIIKNYIMLPDNFKYGIMTFRKKNELYLDKIKQDFKLKITRSDYESK